LFAAVLTQGICGAAAAPTIQGVSPAEVEEERAPFTLTLTGSGFQQGAKVRLIYIREDLLRMDLTPGSVTFSQIRVSIPKSWFDAMNRTPPPTELPIRDAVPAQGFSLKILNPAGPPSNLKGVRIKRFKVRISGFSPRDPLVLAAGQQTQLLVSIERRGWIGEVPVEVLAFEAPEIGPDEVAAGGSLSRQVRGISGTAKIPPGQQSALLPIRIASHVPAGLYRIRLDIPSLGDSRPCPIFQCGGLSVDLQLVGSFCWPNCPPVPPWRLRVKAVTGHTITTKWNDYNLDEEGYEVQRRKPGGAWSGVATLGPNPGSSAVSYTDAGLALDTEYCYRVRNWNPYGEAFSDPTEICATTNSPPLLPSNFEILGGANETDAHFYVDWHDAAPDEDGYRLERRRPPDPAWTLLETTGPLPTSPFSHRYEDRHLPYSTEYCYRLTVWKGDAEASLIACETTASPPPAAPSDVTVTAVTSTSISIQWRDNSTDEDGFTIWYRKLDSSGDVISASWADSVGAHGGTGWMSFTDTGLDPSTLYCYKIDAWRLDGSLVSASATGYDACATTDPSGGSGSAAELAFSSSIDTDPDWPDAGENFTLSWYFCNFGGTKTEAFTNRIERDGGAASFNYSVPKTAAGTCYLQWYNQSGLPAGFHYWYVYLDLLNNVPEVNESNNWNYADKDLD
jgi:hypothetical protein